MVFLHLDRGFLHLVIPETMEKEGHHSNGKAFLGPRFCHIWSSKQLNVPCHGTTPNVYLYCSWFYPVQNFQLRFSLHWRFFAAWIINLVATLMKRWLLTHGGFIPLDPAVYEVWTVYLDCPLGKNIIGYQAAVEDPSGCHDQKMDYVAIYIYIFTYLYIYISIYLYLYIYIYTYLYLYIYISIYWVMVINPFRRHIYIYIDDVFYSHEMEWMTRMTRGPIWSY